VRRGQLCRDIGLSLRVQPFRDSRACLSAAVHVTSPGAQHKCDLMRKRSDMLTDLQQCFAGLARRD